MQTTPKTLMIFVDGLGLGSDDPARNPVVGGVCPRLARLLEDEAVPIDACLGVPGAPQSATGQATLLTGVNAAEAMGRHMEGYPNHELRVFVREHNVFDKFAARGYRSTFANAYYLEGYSEQEKKRRRSVTTVATFKAFGRFRDTNDMQNGRAVYQDLTRESLRSRGYEGPLTAPRDAGRHLLDIAKDHDFTLFEYFQTDIAAHRGDRQHIEKILARFDEFLDVALGHADHPGHLFLLTSDHGNLEDNESRVHTRNPIPFVALGEGADTLRASVKSLVDIVPSLLTLYPARGPADHAD